VGYIENCGELGKWSWKVFGWLRDFWQIETETVPKRFLAREFLWGFCCGKFLVRLRVFGGCGFLGFLSLLNFKYKLWNW
jgi:hypothetical protein